MTTADEFRSVTDAVATVWRKKRRRGSPVPCLSRYLSNNEGGIWVVRDVQSKTVALVNSKRKVSLVDGIEAGSWM